MERDVHKRYQVFVVKIRLTQGCRVDRDFLVKLNHLVLEKYKNLCEEIEVNETEEVEEPVYDEISSGRRSAKHDDRAPTLFCFRIATASRRFMNY